MNLSIGTFTRKSSTCQIFSVKIQCSSAMRASSLRLKTYLNLYFTEIVAMSSLNFFKRARFIFRFTRMKLKKSIFRCSNNSLTIISFVIQIYLIDLQKSETCLTLMRNLLTFKIYKRILRLRHNIPHWHSNKDKNQFKIYKTISQFCILKNKCLKIILKSSLKNFYKKNYFRK